MLAMLKELSHALDIIVASLAQNFHFVGGILLLLWGIHLINFALGYRLNVLGIFPRRAHGLIGIVFAPFLHGNVGHLLFNSIPLFFLANFILLQGREAFYCISLVVIVLSGLAIWLFGRRALHIGASAVIMGYFSNALINAYYQGTLVAIIIGALCLYYFAGLFLSLIPTEEKTSWEGHLFGFGAGIAAIYLCPIVEPVLNQIFGW